MWKCTTEERARMRSLSFSTQYPSNLPMVKNLRRCLRLTILFFAALAFAQQPPVAILHVHVIPMDRERVLDDQTVVVADGKIARIGPASSVRVPAGAKQIDGKGKYLIPGLTDAHVHLYSTTEFPLYLTNGVTTVFNLDGRPAHLLWRKQVASGELLGPTIFSTGPIFGRPHKPEEAVRLVDEQADAGYDAVKVFNQVSKAELPALLRESKRRNLLLMGHISRAAGFDLTVQSGQSIAHLDEFLYTFFNPQHDDNNDHVVLDEAKILPVVRETAAAGVYVIPTLSTYATTVQQATDLDAFLKNPALQYLSPWALEAYEPAHNRFKNGTSSEQAARMRAALIFQRKLVRTLSEAGVPLMVGTDAPDVGPMAGFGIHEELQELVNDGMTPYQVLRAATVVPSQYFRKSGEFGTIEVGKRADLVLLDQNPLTNITNTRGVSGVILRGRWLSKGELDKSVEAISAAYQGELQKVESDLAVDPVAAEQYLAGHDPLRTLQTAAVADLYRSRGPDKFHQLILNVRKADPESRIASEAGMNGLGYNFLGDRKYADAIAILRMNTEDFPNSANTYDSLAEALDKSGDIKLAAAMYAKALKVDPTYVNAEFAKKFVAEHNQK
jgi:imidazolonepropionase-like amidohydrolase